MRNFITLKYVCTSLSETFSFGSLNSLKCRGTVSTAKIARLKDSCPAEATAFSRSSGLSAVVEPDEQLQRAVQSGLVDADDLLLFVEAWDNAAELESDISRPA